MNDDSNIVDDDDEEVFQDACAMIMPTAPSMDFETAMVEAKTGIYLLFNNQFQEASELLKPWVGTSMYHTIGYTFFLFLDALLTLESENIKKASEMIKYSMSLCDENRKKITFLESVGRIVAGTNYDQYSTEEIHAELCYVESLFMKAVILVIENKSLISFFKAAFTMKSCFNSYKDCQSFLNNKTWNNENHKIHFESGVRLGMGGFNLVISLLPSKLIKFLEFVGFSGNKKIGMDELFKCYGLHEGLRHILSTIALLVYNLILVYAWSHYEVDLQLCDDILNKHLNVYPSGALFLFFKGRLEFIKGNISESCDWYTKSLTSQSVWIQIHHLCFWELMWTKVVEHDWKEAQKYADKLLEESKMSPTFFSYQKAIIMLMRYDELTEEEQNEVNQLMIDVPNGIQSIAGQLIPIETFCVKKSERYKAQSNNLVLPALEFTFICNHFKVMCKKLELCAATLKIIDQTLENLKKKSPSKTYDADNLGLVFLLKGACLHNMNNLVQAKEAFKHVLTLEKQITEDYYLIPHALVQLAIIYYKEGNINRAITTLEDAKENYTDYFLEFPLHFQIHSLLLQLEEEKNNAVESAIN